MQAHLQATSSLKPVGAVNPNQGSRPPRSPGLGIRGVAELQDTRDSFISPGHQFMHLSAGGPWKFLRAVVWIVIVLELLIVYSIVGMRLLVSHLDPLGPSVKNGCHEDR